MLVSAFLLLSLKNGKSVIDRIIYTSTKKSLLSTSFLCLWFKMAKLSIQQNVAQIIGEISSKVKPRLSQAADLGAVWGLSPHWMRGKERQDDLGPGNSLSFSSSESQGIWMRTSARVKPWFSWRWGHCCYSSSLQDKTHGMNSHIGSAKNHLEETHSCPRARSKCESLNLLTTTKPGRFCFSLSAESRLNERRNLKAFRRQIQRVCYREFISSALLWLWCSSHWPI